MPSPLLTQYIAGHDGDPWYGTSRTRMLRGVSAADAAATPIPGGHSIWQLVLHMTAWTEEVQRRLDGAAPATPARGDWPPVPAPTDAAWRAAKAALTRAHARVADTVATMPAQRLQRAVGKTREPALGTGVTFGEMLVGLAQHDAYHVGQIAQLKRLLGR
ncbi:MAG: DinB family protein [Gemmatimonadaceae bacterium]|nr:DinB family protein [Gemmatimonadaceae bacterium]